MSRLNLGKGAGPAKYAGPARRRDKHVRLAHDAIPSSTADPRTCSSTSHNPLHTEPLRHPVWRFPMSTLSLTAHFLTPPHRECQPPASGHHSSRDERAEGRGERSPAVPRGASTRRRAGRPAWRKWPPAVTGGHRCTVEHSATACTRHLITRRSPVLHPWLASSAAPAALLQGLLVGSRQSSRPVSSAIIWFSRPTNVR